MTYKSKEGDLFWSGWPLCLELLQYDPNELLPKSLTKLPFNITRNKFIENASHRSVLDIELMIDLDEKRNFNSIK